MWVSKSELDLMEKPTQTPYTLTVREDRNGPEACGFRRTEECGCLMTFVVRSFGLPIYAQDVGVSSQRLTAAEVKALVAEGNSGLDQAFELYSKLQPFGAPADWTTFWSLVRTIQSMQDEAWSYLLKWIIDSDGKATWDGTIPEKIQEKRRFLMAGALQALRLLGVEVTWTEGVDTVDAEQDYRWLRGVEGYQRA